MRKFEEFDWSEDAVAELKLLRADKVSQSNCAKILVEKFGGTLSPSAICGKIRRLGLRAKKRQKPTRAPRKHVTRIIRGGKGNALRIVSTPDAEESLPRELPADSIPFAQRKQLLELKPDDCRWPYGDVGKPDFFFCGAPICKDHPSYCGYHCGVARGAKIYSGYRPWYERRSA